MKTFFEFIDEGKKKLNERNWVCKIDLKDIWDEAEELGDEVSKKSVEKIIERLKACQLYSTSSKLQEIVGEFEMIKDDEDLTLDEVNYVMEMLWDWADENGVWIATAF